MNADDERDIVKAALGEYDSNDDEVMDECDGDDTSATITNYDEDNTEDVSSSYDEANSMSIMDASISPPTTSLDDSSQALTSQIVIIEKKRSRGIVIHLLQNDTKNTGKNIIPDADDIKNDSVATDKSKTKQSETSKISNSQQKKTSDSKSYNSSPTSSSYRSSPSSSSRSKTIHRGSSKYNRSSRHNQEPNYSSSSKSSKPTDSSHKSYPQHQPSETRILHHTSYDARSLPPARKTKHQNDGRIPNSSSGRTGSSSSSYSSSSSSYTSSSSSKRMKSSNNELPKVDLGFSNSEIGQSDPEFLCKTTYKGQIQLWEDEDTNTHLDLCETTMDLLRLKKMRLTNFQITVIRSLQEGKNAVLQAPTGAGKGFAMVVYIYDTLQKYRIANKPWEPYMFLGITPLYPMLKEFHSKWKEFVPDNSGIIVVGDLNPDASKHMSLHLHTDTLKKEQPHVLFATIHGIDELVLNFNKKLGQQVSLNNTFGVMFDEADMMLQKLEQKGKMMSILKLIFHKDNPNRPVALFCSATIEDTITNCLSMPMRCIESSPGEYNSVYINAERKVQLVNHYILNVSPEFPKNQVLSDLVIYASRKYIGKQSMMGIMVFCANKSKVNELFYFLKQQKIESLYKVHRGQDARETIIAMKALDDADKNPCIVITDDFCERSLDKKITMVINYDVPHIGDDLPDKTYIHRTGRTGRWNTKGCAVSICNHAKDHEFMQTYTISNIKHDITTVTDFFSIKCLTDKL